MCGYDAEGYLHSFSGTWRLLLAGILTSLGPSDVWWVIRTGWKSLASLSSCHVCPFCCLNFGVRFTQLCMSTCRSWRVFLLPHLCCFFSSYSKQLKHLKSFSLILRPRQSNKARMFAQDDGTNCKGNSEVPGTSWLWLPGSPRINQEETSFEAVPWSVENYQAFAHPPANQ